MRTKSFILAFLMMMFCSIGFGQNNHWNQVVSGNAFPDHLDVIATVSIDGSLQTASNLQLAAFCGNELRGITTLVYEENLGQSLAYMQLFGKNDDQISFRVYDEANKREYTTLSVLDYKEEFDYGYGLNGKLGQVDRPYEVSFSAVASVPAQGYDVIYETLPAAVEAAQAEQTVTLLKSVEGAGLVINKNVTVDFGGNTYTINQAVGSAGTESQGFQLLKNNNVTIKNGNVAIAEGTNVKWMFNAYANLTLEDVNVDCKNMATPASGEKNYVLVANNGGGATPTVNYSDVNITNFNGGNAPLYIDPTTTLVAESGLNIETIPGYKVVYADDTKTYSVQQLRAYFKSGAYARYAADKPREHFSITIYDVYAEKSLVVKVYNNETLLLTTTYRDEDLDVPGVNRYPVSNDKLTVNNVVSGKVAGSWFNEWAVDPNVENVPNKFEVYVDGVLTNTYDGTQNSNAGFGSEKDLKTYLGFEGVYKQASITRGEDVTYYMTFDEAYAASESNDVITVFDPVVVTENKTYDFTGKTITGENVYPIFRIQNDAKVTVNGEGSITNNDYVFVLGASDGSSSGNLTINGGSYTGTVTAVSVTKGELSITDGEFKVNDSEYGSTYLINCIDANYKDGSAKVVIKGGKFYGFDPENNAAEGAGTNFCANGYISDDNGNGTFTVREGLSGSGTEKDPFVIRNLGELKFFRDHVNAGKTTYNAEGVYVALAANIDMAGEDWSVNIGDDCDYTFDGIFDGNNHTIYNLSATETAQKANGYVCTGLFGAISGKAVVKNLTIENVNITAEFTGNNAAAVVGFVYTTANSNVTIENVTVKGNVNINASGVYGVGAIVGYSYNATGKINIDKCKVETNEGSVITAASGVGAIIGYCGGKTTVNECTINNIDITGKGLVGGIAGITSPSNNKNLTNNTVKNVELTATKAEWVNSTAVAVGTMHGDGLTVSNTTFENVNTTDIVGSVYVNKPTSVVPAVEARIGDVYYTTFDAALAAAKENETITILKTVVLSEDKTLDLANVKVESEAYPTAFRIINDANITVNNATITTVEGGLYNFILGASDSSSAGNLTIKDGTFVANTTVASVTEGALTIEGGEFSLVEGTTDYRYLINCIDANYSNGTATVAISGGTFHNWNPQDNAAETGGHANFCAEGYAATEISEDVWTVLPAVAKIGETLFATLQDAVNAAEAGNTIELVADVELGAFVTIDKSISLNLGEYGIVRENGTALYVNGDVQVTIDGKGTVSGYQAVYVNNGQVTIVGGNYVGNPEAVYVINNGHAVINGGTFSVKEGTEPNFILNEYDATRDVTTIEVKGGTFVGFDPENNAAEGAGTNFCADGYISDDNGDGTSFTVREGVYVAQINNGEKYESLAAATKAAVTGDTVKLLCDINGSEVTVDQEIAKKITIDLGGYKLSSTGTALIAFRGGTELTITNGTVHGNGAAGGTLRATYNATLILGSNLTVTSGPQATAILIQDGRFFVHPNTENVKVEGGIDCIRVQENALEVSLASGTYTEDVAEWCAEGYYSHYNGDGTWTIKEGTFVAQIGEQKYLKLQAAIDAVKDGETINLIANFGETVLIKQQAGLSFTIDGTKDAESNYVFSGTIKVDGNNRPNGAETLTIKNINFVNTSATTYAYFINAQNKANGSGNSEVHNLTVENCYFKSNNWHYAIATRHPYNLVVKNCEAQSVYYFIYNPQGGQSMTIEDCIVTSATYGIGAQKCKEVFVKNYNYTGKAAGFYGRATPNEPTATLENVIITTTLSGQSAVTYWKNDDGSISETYTFNFVGENKLTTPEGTASFAAQSATNAPYQILLGATDATLVATEGLNIESGVEGYTVEYANGVYSLRKLDYVAAIGETKYESLQEAIDAAVNGETVTLLKDINYTFEDTKTTSEGYPILVDVTGKAITLDFANYTINVNHQSTTDRIYAVVYVEDGASLTVKNGSIYVDVDDNTPKVAYMFWKRGTTGTLTIESGNFQMDNSEDSMVYTNGDEIVTVNGGTFTLDMVGTRANGFPCIFNAAGNSERNIIVNGGTYNYDVNHQYWANEVKVPQTLALQNDGNGIWTVVPSVAYVVEGASNYDRYVGYATLAEAVAANQKDAKVTVRAENTIANTVVVEKDLTIDFADYEVSCAVTPAIRIQNGATVVAQNANMNTTGYNFILGASDSSSAGNLTIEGGKYHAQTSVASVTMGNLVIEGGEFSVEPYQGNYAYLINCIDSNYNNGTATVAISGGTFHNWNPQNNAAEGTNTNFCASGYAAVETAAGSNIWTVVPMQGIELHEGWNWFSSYIDIDGEEGLETLQEALAGNATIIKGQTAYTSYSPSLDTWNGGLTSISNKEMYMIDMNGVYSLSLTGDMLDPSTIEYELVKGWNWISYPISEAYAIGDVMDADFGKNDQVKSHHDGFAEYYNGSWYGTLQTLTPGRGYMYGHVADGNLSFAYTVPAQGAKSELRANITAENNHWVPASSQFVNNMTMVAMVEGVNADNYEVAAFVNGEVRGSARPIYIEPLDAYMLFLTIYGNDVEEMTFSYYDLTTGEEYELNDRINYADDAKVGSIAEPYIFNRGTTGIGENSLSEINIYPNPTTTGSEINLEATCEMVEVYNALGVKIAEYHNVDTIDALETAGIYVIRITNNGNVQNCRLVVK